MEIVKIPKMEVEEYNRLIQDGFICRIAFKGDKYPYLAPFLYIFDGKFLYKLNPHVSVEVERYSDDLSFYNFVTMQGYLIEETDTITKKQIRQKFIDMIKEKKLSPNILSALGHEPSEPLESIATEERSNIWKLTGVTDIVALKNK